MVGDAFSCFVITTHYIEVILSGECTQIAISALRPCLNLSHSNSKLIDLHCLSNVFKLVGIYQRVSLPIKVFLSSGSE